MGNISIRKLTSRDCDKLQHISRQTFSEAFSEENTSENMKRYMDQAFSAERLKSELNDENSGFYFVTLENEVIGYLKLNFGKSQTELKEDRGVELERIYVLKQFYGANVGQLLCDKAIQIAEERNAEYLWLGVWEENARAINFYKKNGFVEFDAHTFQLGDDEQTDIMMKRQLK